MSPRLPIPSGDTGTWGEILNNYLKVSHADDGTLKANSVSSTALQPDTVTSEKLSPALRAKLADATLSGTNTGDQTLALSGATLSISGVSGTGSTVTLPSGGAAAWSAITGDWEDQADLKSAVDQKFSAQVLAAGAPIPAGTSPQFIIRVQ